LPKQNNDVLAVKTWLKFATIITVNKDFQIYDQDITRSCSYTKHIVSSLCKFPIVNVCQKLLKTRLTHFKVMSEDKVALLRHGVSRNKKPHTLWRVSTVHSRPHCTCSSAQAPVDMKDICASSLWPYLSLKRGKIGPRLLLMTNRKSHTRFLALTTDSLPMSAFVD